VAAVEVRIWTHFDHVRNPDRDVHIYDAAGFTADGCDVVTTWAVMSDYEERQTWSHTMEAIRVTIAGKSYEGALRPMGADPLGLGLACIDLSPLPSGEQPTTFPLVLESVVPSVLTYDESLFGLKPGTPLLNGNGRIVGVFIGGSAFKPLEFVSARSLAKFFRLAAGFPRSGSESPYSLR
jgi:hypothetical protein